MYLARLIPVLDQRSNDFSYLAPSVAVRIWLFGSSRLISAIVIVRTSQSDTSQANFKKVGVFEGKF